MKHTIYMIMALLLVAVASAAYETNDDPQVGIMATSEASTSGSAMEVKAEQTTTASAGREKAEDKSENDSMEKPEDAGKPESAGRPEFAVQPGVVGLELAISLVQNVQARTMLEANLVRIQERLSAGANVSIESVDEETGEVQIRAREEVSYLGFIKGKATTRFSVNAEGQISENAPWYRFLYAKQQIETQ